MSERNFFSLRYTIPGFTFIIIVLMFNPKLFAYLLISMPNFSDLLFTVITLISGGAIGFHISQIWYWYYHKHIRESMIPDNIHKLLKIYFQTNSDDRISMYNYFIHEQNEGVRAFLSRRWDLYNIFGSTITTLIISPLVGLIIRICFCSNIFLVNETIEKIFSFNSNNFYFTLLIIFIAIVVGMLHLLKRTAIKQHLDMVEFLLGIFCARRPVQ